VSDARIAVSGKDTYRVSGELTFGTVREVLQLSQSLFADAAALDIDLSGVSGADSAGLALLMEWYRLASRANKAIRFIGVPDQLRALAKISDVDELLALPASRDLEPTQN
jgi:phospholipid transport system transporter-binding protein